MASIIKQIKSKVANEILSESELENIMFEFGFFPMDEEADDVIKYTNYKSQIWIDCVRDGNSILVDNVRQVTKTKGIGTKVDPIHSFDDLKLILDYFWKTGRYHHWLCAWLMVTLGRRVSDVMTLTWSNLYMPNGNFRDKVVIKEKKTDKVCEVKFPLCPQERIKEYCAVKHINPLEHYNDKIFTKGMSAFRGALKKAAEAVGIAYPVSTHSFRKFFGNTLYKLHPNDGNAIKIIQYLFEHSSEEITKLYIATIDDMKDKFICELSDYLDTSLSGQNYTVDDSPVIILRAVDFRKIVAEAYSTGAHKTNSEDDFTIINDLISKAESLRVK